LRRTVQELIARYQLEPTLCDIFAEGMADVRLLAWHLKAVARNDIVVYPISTIELSPETVAENHQENNNRGRVLTLANLLHASATNLHVRIACVADRDFEGLLYPDQQTTSPLAHFTDFTSMDLYCFEDYVLDKFAVLVLGRSDLSPDALKRALTPTLHELFLIRAANQSLRWNLSGLSFKKCCSLRQAEIIFDTNEYLNRYLQKNNRFHDLPAFRAEIERLRQIAGDPAAYIHGHDFVELLGWYALKLTGQSALGKPEVVRASLRGCLESSRLTGMPLFRGITNLHP
jgi:hypothetical protein